ncbi:pro-melanin-concentrating hormone, like [Acanthochromis polyacanthus]|uniref:pro-melanin-concentrating hormone, like n=1 Tax=Acanthochromis polyacanthus TaxID=80966 RepID=UPI0022344CA3|nr:pro-melanin-concentrating hormone, like [Acanthochromis polyacanthus]
MRHSLISIIFSTALLFESYGLSAALPMGKTEDGSLEQEALLLSDEATENGLGDADLVARTRGSRMIVIAADPNLLRDLRVLRSGLSLYKRRADANNGQVTEHRDIGQDLNIPILRRDTMRCMVGRVYRPCWEV